MPFRLHDSLSEVIDMTDNRNGCGGNPSGRNEMVCIDTERVLDSCRDRDCFENVRVYLTDLGNDILDRTSSVRTKSAEIAWTYIGIDPVQFNRGFYTVTIRFYLKVCCEACVGNGRSQEFEGICVVEKHVVLFGGESAVSVFRSNTNSGDFCGMPEPCTQCSSVPTAVVEAVAPVVLSTRIVETPAECNCCCCCCQNEVPERILSGLNGTLDFDDNGNHGKYLAISFGSESSVPRSISFMRRSTTCPTNSVWRLRTTTPAASSARCRSRPARLTRGTFPLTTERRSAATTAVAGAAADRAPGFQEPIRVFLPLSGI